MGPYRAHYVGVDSNMGPYGAHHVEVDSWVGDVILVIDDNKLVILKLVPVLLYLLLHHHKDLRGSTSDVELGTSVSVLAEVGRLSSVLKPNSATNVRQTDKGTATKNEKQRYLLNLARHLID